MGVLMKKICEFWIHTIYNDTVNIINIMVLSAYILFWICDGYIVVSGMLALVTLGLGLSKIQNSTIDRHVLSALHGFWDYAHYFSETLIFIAIGLFTGHELK